MSENNYQKYIKFLKKILFALKPRFSFHYVAYTTMFVLVVFSVVSIALATTPNPGHPWSQVGDGVFAITGPSVLRTFTFPDANATVLTTNAAVTLAQGGTGQALVDPDVDSFMSWDDSESKTVWTAVSSFLTSGNGLLLDQTTPQTIINGAPYIPAINGGAAANADLTLQGTTDPTRTSSYVILQPNGGNVGIGTTTPTEKLDVVGNIYINNSGGYLKFYNGFKFTDGVGTVTVTDSNNDTIMVFDEL